MSFTVPICPFGETPSSLRARLESYAPMLIVVADMTAGTLYLAGHAAGVYPNTRFWHSAPGGAAASLHPVSRVRE